MSRPLVARVTRVAASMALTGIAGLSCTDTTAPFGADLVQIATTTGATTGSVQADGYSRIGIVATIAADASADHRTITFTTTQGTLFTGSSDSASTAQRADVVVDGSGHAFVELQSTTVVGEARVQASVKNAPTAVNTIVVQFTPIIPDSVIRFDSTSVTMDADGYSTRQITVRLGGALSTPRSVQFETTTGVFLTGSGQNTTSSTVSADASHGATIVYRAPTQSGTGLIRASTANVTRELPLTLRPVPADSIIRFDSSSVTMDADGFSTRFLTVRLGMGVPTPRTVQFETTAGVFLTGSGQNTAASSVLADASRTATILFRAPAQGGTALVRATAASVTRELPVTLRAVPVDSILRFAAGIPSPEADGATVTTYAVWVSPKMPAAQRVVSFVTTAGTVIAADVPAGQDDSARADIRSPATVVSGRLRATVGSFTRELPIAFRAALPDTIVVDPGKFSMKPGDTVTVTAHLIRSAGTVSRNTFVAFSATDSTGAPAGQFRNALPSDANGNATAIYSAPDGTTKRTITLMASLLDGSRKGKFVITVAP